MHEMKVLDDLRQHPRKLMLLLTLGVGLLVLGYFQRENLDHETLTAYGKELSPVWFVIAFIALPLVGFPVSVFLLLAGIRFGFWGGMGLAAVAMAIHQVVAFRVVHGLFRRRVRAWLAHKGYPVPRIMNRNPIWFTVIFAAVHGPPYFVKIYSLALTDIPFRIYFWAGAPVYIAFCAIPVGAGSAVVNLNPLWITLVVIGMVGMAFFSRWIGSRLAERA
jgi:uncharacterized membrane protein YdjX (TVP38/TMEM64 family)